MSSLSQMYPRKPWELADDLEAFVYIPLFMAFRFHHHHMTKVKTFPVGCTGDAIRAINATNKPLAGRVFGLFWEEYDCEDGYVAGGDAKHDAIRLGEPPVKLSNPSSLLSRLLAKLYTLLQEHYAAINYAGLEKFKCRVKAAEDRGSAPPTGEGEPSVRFAPTIADDGDEDADRILQEILGKGAPSDASPDTAGPSLSKPQARDTPGSSSEKVTVTVVRRCDRVSTLR